MDYSLFNSQIFPFLVDQRFRFLVHQDLVRPGTGETFGRPFARGVDAHFRTEIRQTRSVVERIHRTQRKLDITFGIDVVENFEHHVADILHVYVFIHDHNALSEHSLAQRPDSVHDFARVTGIRLANGNDHQVVEDAFDRQVYVHDLRQRQLHERKEDALDGFAHPGIFHRRLTYDG